MEMEYFNDFLYRVINIISEFLFIFNKTLFKLGDSEISIGTIVVFFASFYLLVIVSRNVRLILLNKILARSKLKKSFRESIANGVRITMMLIGTIIIIQAVGIDLSALSLLAGALGVGIGFGFQKVTDNLISGLTILVEEPIKVGDRVEVGEVSGDIVNISLRSTTIVTNDNISIIVPNSEFISSQVINWSHNNRIVRFRLPIGVSYNEDPEKIKKLLLEVADENPNVQWQYHASDNRSRAIADYLWGYWWGYEDPTQLGIDMYGDGNVHYNGNQTRWDDTETAYFGEVSYTMDLEDGKTLELTGGIRFYDIENDYYYVDSGLWNNDTTDIQDGEDGNRIKLSANYRPAENFAIFGSY